MRLIDSSLEWFLSFELGREYFEEQKSLPTNSAIKYISWDINNDGDEFNFKTHEALSEITGHYYYNISENTYEEM